MAETDTFDQSSVIGAQTETAAPNVARALQQPWQVEQSPDLSAGGAPPKEPTEGASDTVGGDANESQASAQAGENQTARSQASFDQELQGYSSMTTAETANYVLTKLTETSTPAGAESKPFSGLSDEGATALLLHIDRLAQATDGPTIDSEKVAMLRDRVGLDSNPRMAELYFTEKYSDLTPEQLVLEVEAAVQTLSGAESRVMPGHQLRLLLEQSAALAESGATLTDDFAEKVGQLQAEGEKRRTEIGVIADTMNAALSKDETNVAESLFAKAGISITGVSRDEEQITVKQVDENGVTTETEVKKTNVAALFALMVLSDSLLGTDNLAQLGEEIFMNSLAPYLKKWGIDASQFHDTMNYKKYEVFDQFLGGMTDKQCEDFFTKSTDNGTLPRVLAQCRLEHIKKIFNPTGTEMFGSRILFMSNEHLLSQELVNKMYDSMSEQQREGLKIPPRQ